MVTRAHNKQLPRWFPHGSLHNRPYVSFLLSAGGPTLCQTSPQTRARTEQKRAGPLVRSNRSLQKNCQVPASGCCSMPGCDQSHTPVGKMLCSRENCVGVMLG